MRVSTLPPPLPPNPVCNIWDDGCSFAVETSLASCGGTRSNLVPFATFNIIFGVFFGLMCRPLLFHRAAGQDRPVSGGAHVGRGQGGPGGLQRVHQDHHSCHHPRGRLCQKTAHVLGGECRSTAPNHRFCCGCYDGSNCKRSIHSGEERLFNIPASEADNQEVFENVKWHYHYPSRTFATSGKCANNLPSSGQRVYTKVRFNSEQQPVD